MHVFTVQDLQIALNIVKERIEKEKEAIEIENIAYHYRVTNNPKKAIEYYLKLLDIAEGLGYKQWVGITHSNLGNAYHDIGQYQMAIASHMKNLEISEDLGDKVAAGKAHKNLGNAYYSSAQYQMAIECHTKQLEIAEKLGDRAGVGTALWNLGNDYQRAGQYEMAIEYHTKYLEIAQELGDQAGVGRAHGNLGNAYHRIAQYQMAIMCHKKHLAITEELGDKAGVGTARANLGNDYHKTGQYQMAIECHKKHLDIAKELDDKAGVARAYGNLGDAYNSIGHHQTAIECHKKSLEIAEKLGDKKRLAEAHHKLGIAYNSIAYYQMAKDCHTKHLEIAEELGDRAGIGNAHGNLGTVYNGLAQYQIAIECHTKHLEITEALGDKAGAGIAHGNLGTVYDAIGRYQMAIDCYTKHLEIAKEVSDKVGEGRAYGNLGVAFHRFGEYQMAIKCHKRHLKIAEELHNEAIVGFACGNLGNSYCSIGQYQMAIECLERKLEIAERLVDKAGVGVSHGYLGSVYTLIGQYEMAIGCYKKWLQIAEELDDIRGKAASQAHLAMVYQRDNDHHACRLSAKSILDCLTIRRNAIHQDEFKTSLTNMFAALHKLLLDSLLNLNQVKAALLVSDSGKANALYDLMRENVDAVLGSALEDQQINLFQGISHDPSSKTIEAFFDIFLSQIIHSMQDGSIVFYSFDLWGGYLHMWVITRSGVFHEKWRTSNGISTESYLYRIVKSVRKSLWRAERKYCVPYPENHEKKLSEFSNLNLLKVKECTYARDLENRVLKIFTNRKPNHGFDHGRDLSVEKCVREKYHLEDPLQSHGGSRYSLTNVKGTAREEQKLCEYYLLDRPSAMRIPSGRSPKPEKKSMNAYTDTDICLQKLYSILIAPIEEYLIGTKLLIIPDGPLFLLPFCALLSQKEGHLCEKYSLQFTPALQVLNASLLKPVLLGPAFFVGNPMVGEVNFRGQTVTLPLLPSATVEARECARYFDADPLLERNATKAKVLRGMRDASIIHIAAHAHMGYADIFLAPNEAAPKPPSEEHYLLTAKDVLECHLNARLVVLSCCHSGRGEISDEGVVGVARSFLGAGARSVLVTLWQIPDEETMEFMKMFYDKVCQGISVCCALQETMIELKKKFSVAEWAPFQIVGEDIALSKEDIDEIRRKSLTRASGVSTSSHNGDDEHGTGDN